MVYKKLSVLLVLLLFSCFAMAANPTVVSLDGDGNYYYTSVSPVTLSWTFLDADQPGDVNMQLSYLTTAGNHGAMVRINAATDENMMLFCDSGDSDTIQTCTYSWTLPTDLDANYHIDVNVFDVDNADDVNVTSGQLQIDTNACTSRYSVSGSDVSFSTVCTGYGSDENGGTETIYYASGKHTKCDSGWETYSIPITKGFGEYTFCYYATDGLGNTETQKGFTYTFDSGAYNIAKLTELLLAGIIVVTILAAVAFKSDKADGGTLIMLLGVALMLVLSIIIISAIL